MDFKVLSYSKNHIHGVFCSGIAEKDFFTGVYGSPSVSNQPSFWSLLKSLQKQDFSWIVISDFKELLIPSEKLGAEINQIGKWVTSKKLCPITTSMIWASMGPRLPGIITRKGTNESWSALIAP